MTTTVGRGRQTPVSQLTAPRARPGPTRSHRTVCRRLRVLAPRALATPPNPRIPCHFREQFARHRHASCFFEGVRLSYVLPVRAAAPLPDEFFTYVCRLHTEVDLIVADGSEDAVFAEHHRRLPAAITHIGIDHDLSDALNGKV